MSIRESMIDAFTRIWNTYQDLIENIPQEHWRAGDIEYLIPARLVYHVLEAADFYSSSTPKGFVWGQRFDVDWKKTSPEQWPTKEQTQAYFEEVTNKVDGWLRGLSDSALLSAEKAFPWTGKTTLGRALYLLAHCRQHIGEINAELRRRELPRIKWR